MKRLCLTILLVLLTFGPSTAQAQTRPSIAQTVGTGNNTSYFVINFNDGPGGSNNSASNYVFAYHWDGSATSETMLGDLDKLTSPRLQVNQTYYPDYNAYFVNGFSYLTHSQTGYYNSGTDQASWAYWVMDSGTWTQPQTYGVSGRNLFNGSYDGWTFHLGSESAPEPIMPQAAPEPAQACLFALGAATLVLLGLRHKHNNRSAA